jgi:hypothetical protein
VFTRADIGSIEVVKKALSLFALRSGLSPNLSKSDIFFGNVPQATKEAILNCLPFRMGTFPIRYLGVPLSPVSLKVADFGVLVTKVRNRILNWKSKFLSLGGRKQLIVSVLQSLQLYWMAIFAFPSTIIHDLEALFRDFLWSHGNSSKGRCRVAWSLVCRPKHSGGLGFKRLSVWNRSLLTKHIWDLALPKSSLWVRWVRMHYLRGENLWVARVTQRWSWVLRKIMLIRPQIRPFIKSTIGNGSLVNAWEDFWMGCGPLSSFISYRFIHASGLSVTTTVSDLALAFSSSFPDAWTSRFPSLVNVSLPVIRDNAQDGLTWISDSRGDVPFSVSVVYSSLDGHHVLVPWHSTVWFTGHIPKHAFCLWVACHKRHPTQDRILSWSTDPPDFRCSLCRVCMDSHDHLFFECPYSLEVWVGVRNAIGWADFPSKWEDVIDTISMATPRHLIQRLALAASVYMIWQERNRRTFSDEKRPPALLIKEILAVIRLKMDWERDRKKVCHGVLGS